MLALAASAREWTDVSGRKMEGRLLQHEAGEVTIKRAVDGRVVTFSTELLSAGDQDFLRTLRAPDQADASDGEEENFSGLEWPRRTRLSRDYRDYDVEVVREDSAAGIYIYQTPNFEFKSDVKLARKVVRSFGKVFEGTLAAMQAFPLKWAPKVAGPRFRARLFEHQADYLAGGGLPNSGGIYFAAKREIWLPLSSLGMRKTSSRYTFDGEGERSTLIHEITHQVHHEWLNRLPTWMTEGLAVYMESIPEDDGEFSFDKQDIQGFVNSRDRGHDIRMMDPARLMGMSAREWSANFAKNPTALRRQYLSAFMLFHYFLHFDGRGDGKRIWAYVRAIEAGQPEAKARELLFDGRDNDQLIKAITRAYRRERIKVKMGDED